MTRDEKREAKAIVGKLASCAAALRRLAGKCEAIQAHRASGHVARAVVSLSDACEALTHAIELPAATSAQARTLGLFDRE